MERLRLKRAGGSIIEGYSILARLGKGGMGAVFKALHIETGRLVALKILPVNLARNKNYIKRFLREAKSAAQLDHPNITKVYEVGNYRGIFYFSMEYVDGETLIERLRREGRLHPMECLRIAKQVALGLKHAHKNHHIIHRDIKPENIMLTRDGVVKLTDLGLAKKIGAVDQDITITGQVIGTPCYMSPEQITTPKQIDHRVDIYGLGATMYHLLTGRRPFLAETGAQIMLRVLNDQLEFEPEDDVPPAVQSLVLKMVAKSPELRHSSADDLLRDIDAVMRHLRTGEPVRLIMPKRPRSFYIGRAHKERRRTGWAFLLFLLVAAAVAFMFTRALRRKPVELTAQQYFAEGLQRAEDGNWVGALDMFNYALRKDSSLPGAWNNKGTALFNLGRVKEALVAFDVALKLEPNNPDVLKNRGVALFSLGRYEEALDMFEKALKLSPELADAKKGKNLCLEVLRKRGER